jgi:hypothetical protein
MRVAGGRDLAISIRDINHFAILVLPGSHNSGPDHWQTHWEAAFANMRRVEQDGWEASVYSAWSSRFSIR